MNRIIEFSDGSHLEFKVIQNWRKQGDLGRNICITAGCKHCSGDLYIPLSIPQFCSTSSIFTSNTPAKIIQETP